VGAPVRYDDNGYRLANAIVRVVDAPFGKRPFRVHIDPANDGAEIVNGFADRVRTELLRNMGLADLLHPAHRTEMMSGCVSPRVSG
jgi:hypothetical protein